MTMPLHLAEPREENLFAVFLLKFHTAPQKKEKKILLLLMQVTTWHPQKIFDGTPNMNCLALPL
jgi:hypothetical protein